MGNRDFLKSFFHFLRAPSFGGAAFLVALTVSIIVLGVKLIMPFLRDWQVVPFTYRISNLYDLGDLSAIQLGMLSILFPLVMLVLDRSDDKEGGLVSRREILLRHAYAFPIGTIIVTSSVTLAFVESKHFAFAIVAVAAALALFVFSRLFEIGFSHVVQRKIEQRILEEKISEITSIDVKKRVENDEAKKQLNDIDSIVSMQFFTPRNFESYSVPTEIVIAGSSGVVRDVVKGKLIQAIKLFRKLIEISDESNSNKNRIFIYYLPGDSVTQGDVICKLIGNSVADRGSLERIGKLIGKAFIIRENADPTEYHVDALLSNLNNLTKNSITQPNQESHDKYREFVLSLYSKFLFSLSENSVIGVYSHFQIDSDSLNDRWRIFSGIVETQRNFLMNLFRDTGTDRDSLKRAMYVTFSLLSVAYEKRHLLGVNQFLQQVQMQAYLVTAGKFDRDVLLLPARSLGDFFRFQFISDLKSDRGNFDLIGWKENLRYVIKAYQHVAHYYVVVGDVKAFEKTVETLNYEFELQLSTYSKMKSGKIELNTGLFEKLEILIYWRYESYLGLAGLAWQCFDGYIAKDISNEIFKNIFAKCIDYLPEETVELMRLYLFASNHEVVDKWGWITWEDHPANQVFHPRSDRYVDKVFAYLFLRTGLSVDEANKVNLSDLELKSGSIYPFREVGTLRLAMLKMVENSSNRIVDVPGRSEVEGVLKFFDLVVSEEKRRAATSLINQPISLKTQEEFKLSFSAGFFKEARLRQIFGVDLEKEIDGIVPWGLNMLERREFFVSEPSIGTFGIAEEMGRNVGRSEDIRFFDLLYDKASLFDDFDSAISSFDLPILKSESLLIILPYGSEYLSGVNRNKRYTAGYLMAESRFSNELPGFIGVYAFGDTQIPVISIFIKNRKKRNSALICSRDAVRITQYVREMSARPINYFEMVLSDPSQDMSLRDGILSKPEKYQYLKELAPEDREKFVGLYIWLRILEKTSIQVEADALVKRIEFSLENREEVDELGDDQETD